MKKLSSLLYIAIFAFQFSPAMADGGFQCTGTPHTIHMISTNKTATCVLSKLFEPETFCLTDASGNRIEGTSFQVTPDKNASFAMIFGSGADFNMEYALTCTVDDGAQAQSPKVIFTIGANGPADPDVSVINQYGAKGTWQATGQGENYSIVF